VNAEFEEPGRAEPRQRLEHFTILARIGAGGSAEVFRARNDTFNGTVALKRWRAPLTPEQRRRFLAECKIHWALSGHPNIVRLYWAEAPPGEPAWLATELCETSLADRLRHGPPLSEAEAYQLADDILAGLAAIHAEQHIHRDIKPANVLLNKGRGLLCDLGIATQVESATRDHAAGTDSFMAPELGRGAAPSYRSDVYSAAVTIRTLMSQPAPAPVTDLLTRAASFQPTDRPADASEFRRLWREAQHATPPPVRRELGDHIASVPPPSSRTRRQRTTRTAVASGAILAIIVVAGLAGHAADAPPFAGPTTGMPPASTVPTAATQSSTPVPSPSGAPSASPVPTSVGPTRDAPAGGPGHNDGQPGTIPPRNPASEICLYDVKAGESVPITSGGSITAQTQVRADVINAISVIVGLDPTISNLGQKHPVALHVKIPARNLDVTLSQPDIVNNGFTRFNFSRPVNLAGPEATVSMELINRSDSEPIGMYIKQPDTADTLIRPVDGVLVAGHRGQESPYRKHNYALSGCIAGRAS